MIVEARISGVVEVSGDCTFLALEATQKRGATDPPLSVPGTASLDTVRWDGIVSNPRWTDSRLVMDGKTYRVTRMGVLEFDEVWDTSRQKQLKMDFVGSLFSIPSDTPPVTPYEPCPPAPSPVPAHPSPRLWGNKPIEAWLSYGSSPTTMRETKLFKGLTTDKQIDGDVAIKATVTALDLGFQYANIPLCYELPPFAGLHRGEITKQVAATLGIDPADVICPPGNLVTKPILLTNASLIPFLNDFWAGEDGFAYFNEDGKLVVELIELKDDADVTLDASAGDWFLDSFKETPPTSAPTTIIAVSTATIAGDSPDANELIKTTVTVETTQDFYNPRCVKVRPSGSPSYLYGDGSYRIHQIDLLIVVQKVKTETTTKGGITTRNVVTTWQWYNPRFRDPNFDTNPTGTSYDGAYGDKTFHAYEQEQFMEVSKIITENFFDDFGTPQRTVESVFGFFNRQTYFRYFDGDQPGPLGRGQVLANWISGGALLPSAYVFAGGTECYYPSDFYGMTQQTETANTYGSDGTLSKAVKTTKRWGAPEGRCDITDKNAPPPPPVLPPPAPPAPLPPWRPTASGPTVNAQTGLWDFTVTLPTGTPNGETTAEFVGVLARLVESTGAELGASSNAAVSPALLSTQAVPSTVVVSCRPEFFNVQFPMPARPTFRAYFNFKIGATGAEQMGSAVLTFGAP